MAVRLSIAFGTSAESWLSQQVQYDLWHVGSDPDEKLARHLDAARPFELAQLSLNFQPSLFTLSFSQLFDWLPKKGTFLQALENLCGR